MAPPLRFALGDGRPATLLLGETSIVLSVDDLVVSSWDLDGRPYALVRESGTYRRGLDGGLLWKHEARAEAPRLRQRLTAAEGDPIVESARSEAIAARQAVAGLYWPLPERAEALAGLDRVISMDTAALAADAERFRLACGPVGILPPDQYLSLVVRLTEGCSWSRCSFCSLYAKVPFRVRSRPEIADHLEALQRYFGGSVALRRSVFLGDANALCLAQDRLLEALASVSGAFPGRPMASFVDAWTGRHKSATDWQACGALGLRRVYVGLETGDPALLAWLGKAGSPDDAVRLVRALHDGGIEVGVIVLTGAGGERFAATHVMRTRATLEAMRLGSRDLVYFSEYVVDPELGYGGSGAAAPDLVPLAADGARAQQDAIAEGLEWGAGAPRLARYDLREFVY